MEKELKLKMYYDYKVKIEKKYSSLYNRQILEIRRLISKFCNDVFEESGNLWLFNERFNDLETAVDKVIAGGFFFDW